MLSLKFVEEEIEEVTAGSSIISDEAEKNIARKWSVISGAMSQEKCWHELLRLASKQSPYDRGALASVTDLLGI